MDAVTGGLGLPKVHQEHHRASAGNIVSYQSDVPSERADGAGQR